MRAVAVAEVPSSVEVIDLPTPEPEPGEVLVRVAASSINGFDVATAAGMLEGLMEHRYPLVLGKDFAGTVEAVGHGVSGFVPGDAVFGVVTKPYLGTGSLAEYVAVDASFGVAPVPAGLAMGDAGALALAGTAALNAVDAVAVAAGEQVLVSGATGGVGAIALQYALTRGAEVIATARPGAEADFVRGIGGDAVRIVDYSGDLAVQVKKIAPDGVPAALHFAGDAAQIADLVAPGGRLASTLGFGPEAAGDRQLTVTSVMAAPDAETLRRLAADVVAGTIRVPVTTRFALADVAEAFAAFTSGALGKIAVTTA